MCVVTHHNERTIQVDASILPYDGIYLYTKNFIYKKGALNRKEVRVIHFPYQSANN